MIIVTSDNMNIKELITSIRKKAAGHTCVGTGNFSLDVLAERHYYRKAK